MTQTGERLTREQAAVKFFDTYDWAIPIASIDCDRAFNGGWDAAITNSPLPQVVEALERVDAIGRRYEFHAHPVASVFLVEVLAHAAVALKVAKGAMNG